MNASTWAIKKPVPTLLLFIILMCTGMFGFSRITVQDFPDIEFPTVVVTASLPGANAVQLETEVTRKLEDSVASIDSISHIQSRITDGVSSTTITFDLEKDIQEAVSDVRDAVTRVRNQMPAALTEPQIVRITSAGAAIQTFAVQSNSMTEEELSWFVDNTLSKHLLAVPGVAKLARQGGVTREITVTLDPVALNGLGTTAYTVANALRVQLDDIPGGTSYLAQGEQSIRVLGRATLLSTLRDLRVSLPDGRSLRLTDIATINDDIADRNQTAMLNNTPVVSVQVYRAKGYGEIDVSKRTKVALAPLVAQFKTISITEVTTTVPRVEAGYKASMHALFEGGILAIIVVFLFLRNARATFVSALALPLSIIPTFAFMVLLDFSLNTLTFLALTLIVGVLIDDAIVEVENIVRHLQAGKTPRQAAIEAAEEIGLAVVATSLTLVAVFLPTAFMGGVSGRFFKQFGGTAAIAVLISLLVARLLTPMMAAYMLKPEPVSEKTGPILLGYLKRVSWCLSHPWLTLGGAVLFLGVSLSMMLTLPASFLPVEDRGQIALAVELAPGSSFEQTLSVVKQTSGLLQARPEVVSVYATVGAGGTAGGGPGRTGSAGETRKGSLIATLTKDRTKTQSQIEQELRSQLKQITGARFSLGIGASGEKATLTLASDNGGLLTQTANLLEKEMRGLEGLGNIVSSANLTKPELQVIPIPHKMAEYGVTTIGLAQTLRLATVGDYETNLAKFNTEDRQIPINVRMNTDLRKDLSRLAQIKVPSTQGSVPLFTVADFSLSGSPAQIDRFDRKRNVTLSVDLAGKPLGEVNARINKLPALVNLPSEVTKIASGDLERMNELFGNFGWAMLAGVFCVYAVLVLLFHDFAQPVTLLVALPLSFGGAFGLLALCGFPLSLPVLIGLLMLMGIVTKNSILLVEYALLRQIKGDSSTVAILDACSKRVRPILMTTVAMIAGMLPMAFNIGGQGSFRAPMATAVIGGLVTSTLLSLLVVPVVFQQIDRVFSKKHKKEKSREQV